MMKCCCLIVFIFCTFEVSNGGILSGICHASNGTCGRKGVRCNETFGSGWMYNGLCCNDRPCCKFSKAPDEASWNTAQDHCASTDGAYLWRPNTVQEANAIKNEINSPSTWFLWSGANDIDNDGIFTFVIENGPFSFDDLPFGSDGSSINGRCVKIINGGNFWGWMHEPCTFVYPYICEYKLRVCP